MSRLLEVKNLKTSFRTHIGDVQAVRGVSLYLDKGKHWELLENLVAENQ